MRPALGAQRRQAATNLAESAEEVARRFDASDLAAREFLMAADIEGRLTDRVLLVKSGRAEAIVEELRRMSHTPQVVAESR